MGQQGSLDYPRMLKFSFGTGVGLFVLGVIGLAIGPSLNGPLPAWERTLFFDMEVIGLLVAFFSPFVFGIFLPLIE